MRCKPSNSPAWSLALQVIDQADGRIACCRALLNEPTAFR
jgi:hypothetical protein